MACPVPRALYQWRSTDGQKPLGNLVAGDYTLVIEAAREVGGREVVRVPFKWPASTAQHLVASGRSDLDEVSLDFNP